MRLRQDCDFSLELIIVHEMEKRNAHLKTPILLAVLNIEYGGAEWHFGRP